MRANFQSDIEFVLWIINNPEQINSADVQQWLSVDENNQLYNEFVAYREAAIINSVTAPDIDDQWSIFVKKTEKKPSRQIARWSIAVASMIATVALILNFYSVQQHSESDIALVIPVENGIKLMSEKGEELSHNQIIANEGEPNTNISYNISELKTEKQEIKRHRIIVPKGMDMMCTLEDGTQVWLNAGSSLTYPVHFENHERVVELSGECYFKVTPDKNRPFFVKTAALTTKVLGTEFNIRAYDAQNQCVTLVEGSVYVSGGNNSMILKPNESLTFAANHFTVNVVDVQKHTSWKDGFFYYDDDRLESIITELADWYNVKIISIDDEAKDISLRLWVMRNESIDVVVKRLNEIGNIKVELYGNQENENEYMKITTKKVE